MLPTGIMLLCSTLFQGREITYLSNFHALLCYHSGRRRCLPRGLLKKRNERYPGGEVHKARC